MHQLFLTTASDLVSPYKVAIFEDMPMGELPSAKSSPQEKGLRTQIQNLINKNEVDTARKVLEHQTKNNPTLKSQLLTFFPQLASPASSPVDVPATDPSAPLSATPAPALTSTPAPTQTPTPSTSTSATTPQDLQQSIQTLKQSVDAFNQIFKSQHQVAEPAIRQVYDALNQMSKISPNMRLDPQVNQGIQDLISTLQAASQEEQQDAQFMQQIGMKASQLAAAMGLNPKSQGQFDRGQGKQPPQAPAAPGVTPAIPPANPNKGSGWGSSIGRGVGNMVGNIRSAPGNFIRNLQQGYQRGRQMASSKLFIKTAESYLE